MSEHPIIYCPRPGIIGYDQEKSFAEGVLAAHSNGRPSMVIFALDHEFVYGQCTFRHESGDSGLFKFIDEFETLTTNSIFSILAKENGLRHVIFIENDLYRKFRQHRGFRDAAGLFVLASDPAESEGTSVAKKVVGWARERKSAEAAESPQKQPAKERDLLKSYVGFLEGSTKLDNLLAMAYAVLHLEGEDHAFAALERRLTRDPADRDVLTLRGMLHADNAAWNRAADDLRCACAHSDAPWAARLWLGKAEWALQRYDAALATVDRALAADLSAHREAAGHAHALKAVILADSGDHRAAMKSFDTAVRLEGGNCAVHLLRARSLERLGRLNDALDAAEQALVIESDSPWGLAARYRLLQQLGPASDQDEAFKRWKSSQDSEFEASCFAPGASQNAAESTRSARRHAFEAAEPERHRLRAALAMPRIDDLLGDSLKTTFGLVSGARPDDTAARICRCRLRLREKYWLLGAAWQVLGSLLYEAGQFGEAIRSFEYAVTLDPGDVAHHCALVRALHAAGHPQRSKEAMALAGNFGHSGFDLAVKAAEIALAAGEKDEAQTLATEAQQRASEKAIDNWRLGRLLSQLGRNEESLSAFEQAALRDPLNADYVGRVGGQLWVLSRPEDALSALDKALGLEADHEYSNRIRGHVLYDLKRFEEATNALERLLDQTTDKIGTWQKLAMTYRQLDRRNDAVEAWRKFAAAEPSDATGWAELGYELWLLDQNDAALVELDKAIALDADYAYALAVKGAALRDLKRPHEALTALEHALRANPDYSWATNKLAEVFVDLGEPLVSVVLCDRMLKADPTYTTAIETRADALMAAGKREEGIGCIQSILTVPGRDATADAKVCRFFDRHNLYAELLVATAEATSLYPDDVATLRRRAFALLDTGRSAEALEVADRALRIDPNEEHALACKTSALFNMGPGYIGDCVEVAEGLCKISPTPSNHMLRANAFWAAGRIEQAKAEYAVALLGLQAGGFNYSSGWCCLQVGDAATAIDHFDRYLAEHPDGLLAASDRALALLLSAPLEDARQSYDDVMRSAAQASILHRRGNLVPAMANIRARLPYLTSERADLARLVTHNMAAMIASSGGGSAR